MPNGRITTKECNIEIIAEHGFLCRISEEYYEIDLMVKDVWNYEPRAICNYPNVVPSWYIGEIAYNDPNQYRMTVLPTYQGRMLVA